VDCFETCQQQDMDGTASRHGSRCPGPKLQACPTLRTFIWVLVTLTMGSPLMLASVNMVAWPRSLAILFASLSVEVMARTSWGST